MPIAMNAVAVNGEPINLLRNRMQARIGIDILIIIWPEDIEYDAHFGDVGLLQFL